MLAPVKPIMDIKRDDDRFVESKAVLSELQPQDNLAAMEWEDFEHLVRELFEKEFAATGGEVRVTQASRDRGVDAIAFDPDPIRGGKFVIQAKRYNMPVPVSAVRDLFGTIIAEGATKGILVTTSHFGRDSREFAKDKPITLIDGENLIHMFQKHGRNVHIAMLPKGDPRRGVG
jgi:restriction system protein